MPKNIQARASAPRPRFFCVAVDGGKKNLAADCVTSAVAEAQTMAALSPERAPVTVYSVIEIARVTA